ncbi:sugar phosphate isomerase/epimerase [Lachnospiraceae bacterium OF09-33XD]|nr:sugar phosphate isomerase/epimerase [Lachnospiraceae bacterium OF09-33XD]
MVKLGYMTNAFGPLVGTGGGVTCMKDVGYLTMGSDEDAVRAIASKGYSCIEIFEGNITNYENNPQELLDICGKYGVSILGICVGCHFIYQDALEDELYKVSRISALAKKLGAKHIAFCGGAIRGKGIQEGDYELLAAGMNEAAKIVRSHGLIANFHPHLGSLAENPEQIDRLFALTDISFCPDTAHLAAGGGDPLEIIRKYYDRIQYVHLKDLSAEGEFVPLGRGTLDLEGVINFLKEKGYSGDWLVECDGYSGDPEEAAGISYEYLKGKLI